MGLIWIPCFYLLCSFIPRENTVTKRGTGKAGNTGTAHGSCPGLQQDVVLARARLTLTAQECLLWVRGHGVIQKLSLIAPAKAGHRSLLQVLVRNSPETPSHCTPESACRAPDLVGGFGHLSMPRKPGGYSKYRRGCITVPPPPTISRARVLVGTRVPAGPLMSPSYRIRGFPAFWSLAILWILHVLEKCLVHPYKCLFPQLSSTVLST